MVEQELKEIFGFFLLETDNGIGEPLIDVESLLAGHRVDTNNGVLGLDGFPANRAITFSGMLGLGNGRVQCPETLETLLELGRETIVGLNLGQVQGIASADLGLVKDEEESGARRLQFVGDIRMPPCLTDAVGKTKFTERVLLSIAIDNVEFGEALDVCSRRVPLDGAEVPFKHKPNSLAER